MRAIGRGAAWPWAWAVGAAWAAACGPPVPDPGDRPVDPQAGAGDSAQVASTTSAVTAGDVDDGEERRRRTGRVERDERLIPEDAVEEPGAPPTPVAHDVFTGGERFLVEEVPEGVTFHRVGTQPDTWEVRDADGRRVALLQEEEWREAMAPRSRRPKSAPLQTETAGRRLHVEDWGGRPAELVTHQLTTTMRLYRVERLEEGTDWLVRGFRYLPTRIEVTPAGEVRPGEPTQLEDEE
ncbi:MAG: hypothetical protein ACODAU_12020 [Myxococcota bacterium]